AVHVVEKAAAFTEIGAGLQLAPNATRVLSELGVMDALAAHAVFPARLLWMDALGEKPITSVDLGDAFRKHFGHPYLVMHRGDLLSVLLEACKQSGRVTLEASRDVVAVEDRGDRALARCADGETYEADILIGADGLWSGIRRMLHPDEPTRVPYVAYRGTLPMNQASAHAGADTVVMWVGPNMHFVQYSIRAGEEFNQVAVFRSPTYSTSSDDWGTPEQLDAHYAQCCGYVRESVKLMWRHIRWPMYDREPIADWVRNRIALLGDAAHPMFQYIAQGACQAIEDAYCLARCVAEIGDPARALTAYRDARYLRTARVQLTARAMGAFFHLDGINAQLRNAMLATRSATDYAPLDWLYGHKA
ncbi:MAG TPA: FAD-dependent monooxygenase, partial [Stellaceae bacterium]|nr:FAD-dependent monooxygenase [Stellaceae bacterium]